MGCCKSFLFRTEELALSPEDVMGPAPPPRSVYAYIDSLPMAEEILNSDGEKVGTRSVVPVAEFLEFGLCTLPILGDFRVELIQRRGLHEDRLFHFWCNAAMLTSPKLVMRKWQLDGACKDRKHKKFNPHVRIELLFTSGHPLHTAIGNESTT